MDRVWMAPPFGAGEPKEVDATPAVLTPLMVAGWNQCEPPAPYKRRSNNRPRGAA
jgi:hypothetical protein